MSLEEKAISIKGKDYILVKDRILEFNRLYPQGSIKTEILSSMDSITIIVKATVTPDLTRIFTGHSQATIGDGYINKTSALENAETSAVGRALAMMGIGVIDSIASVDEIAKANGSVGVEADNVNKKYMDQCIVHIKQQIKDNVWNVEDVKQAIKDVTKRDLSPTELIKSEMDKVLNILNKKGEVK